MLKNCQLTTCRLFRFLEGEIEKIKCDSIYYLYVRKWVEIATKFEYILSNKKIMRNMSFQNIILLLILFYIKNSNILSFMLMNI